MDPHPGSPDSGSPDGDPRFGGAEFGAAETGDEEGPRFALLPPDDRLWRHPSESARADSGPHGSGPHRSGDPRESGRKSENSGPHGRPASGFLGTLAGAGWSRTITVAVVAGLVGAMGASAIGFTTGWWGHQTTIVRSVFPTTPVVSLADAGGAAPVNWTAIDDSVAASVVSITVIGPSGPQQGSGLLLASDNEGNGYIITDRSLFAPAQDAGYMGGIEVNFLSGVTSAGKLVGQDELSGLAVVEVGDVARDTPADTGSVADIQDADPVLAVGARTASLSTGAVSGEDRTVDLADGSDMDNLIAVTMPAMTASATGGPLLDQYGQVVGITVNLDPVDNADQPFTYAVPIDEANRVAAEIIAREAVTHPWIGITDAEDLPSETAHQFGLTGGVQAGQVSPGGPAARAGIRADDILTSFDGKPLTSVGSLIADLDGCDPGRTVPVTYVHNGQAATTVLALANEPGDAP